MYFASVVLQNLVLGTQILMVAVGLYLVYAASRIMHLAVGAVGTASAYILWDGVVSGWPFPLAFLAALGTVLILGFLSARLLEPFAVRREPLLGLLVSFAFGMILEALISIFFGTDGKSFQTGILPAVSFGGILLDVPGIITIALGALLALGAWGVVRFTANGRLLRAVAENSALATSLGVDDARVRRFAHIATAGVAAAAVALSGWHTALDPLMGFHLIVAAFIALLMGGVGDVRGTIISSYALAVIPGLVIGYSDGLSENWRLVFVFCLAALVLAVRPEGIFSKKLRKA